MKTYLLRAGYRQTIGRAGDREAVTVAVDIREWLTSYPAGTGTFLVERPDGVKVPLEGTKDTTAKTLSAAVPEELLAWPGVYLYQPVWVQAGTQIAGEIYSCQVMGSTMFEHPPAVPPPQWAEKIFVAAETVVSAERSAQQASEAAETAQTAAETAQGKAEDAQEAAETAQGKAEDAQEAAEAAAAVAETHNYGISVSDSTLVITPPLAGS